MQNHFRPSESRAWDRVKHSILEDEIEQLHTASFAWALLCCRWSRYEAEEVLQAAYFKVVNGRARYDGRSTVKTWLFGVIRKTAADQRRRQVFELTALRRWFLGRETPLADPPPDQRVAQEEKRERILNALGRLALRQREVLDLVFYQGLTVEESAEVMGVSVGTARAHYERGKRRLVTQLEVEDLS